MTMQIKPLTDVTNQALHVLAREIGTVDMMRFLNQFYIGNGNYTEERALLFDHLTLDDILYEIRVTQNKK